MRAAVTKDRAMLGSNLSAGDGPKLAGAAGIAELPLPVGRLFTEVISYGLGAFRG